MRHCFPNLDDSNLPEWLKNILVYWKVVCSCFFLTSTPWCMIHCYILSARTDSMKHHSEHFRQCTESEVIEWNIMLLCRFRTVTAVFPTGSKTFSFIERWYAKCFFLTSTICWMVSFPVPSARTYSMKHHSEHFQQCTERKVRTNEEQSFWRNRRNYWHHSRNMTNHSIKAASDFSD